MKELVDKVDINRSTFYLHYSDIYQMLQKIEEEALENITCMLTDSPVDFSDKESTLAFTTKFFFAFIFPFWLALVFFLFCTFTTAVYMLFYDFLSLGIFCFDSSRSKYKTDIPNKNRKEIEKNDKDNEIPRY